jgi:hypothetical protein
MTRMSLSVNDTPIKLDFFVAGYLENVIGGIIASLHDTAEIETLRMEFDSSGRVTIDLNNADVPLNDFATEIIRSTVAGMVSTLKGVKGKINRLEITMSR